MMGWPRSYTRRRDLQAAWDRLERGAETAPLDPELVRWCRHRARQLFGAEVTETVAPPGGPVELLAEQFWLDVHGIDDELAAAVRTELGDAGMVGLVILLGLSEVDVRTELMLA
jgi:hypothetical protein